MADKLTDDNGRAVKKPRRWKSRAQKAATDTAAKKKGLAALARARQKGVSV